MIITYAIIIPKPNYEKGETMATAKKTSMQVTATEKRLVKLYREADSATKKSVMAVLSGKTKEALLETVLTGVIDALTDK